MAIRITLNVGGAVRVLTEIQGRLTNLVPALTAIKEVALDSIRQNFTDGGRPQAWAPLKWRQGTPLVDSGRLRASITGEVNATSVVLGTNLPYAAIHQFGGTIQVPAMTAAPGKVLRFTTRDGSVVFTKRTSAHQVTIPARPYMVLQPADETTMAQIITAYLAKGL